MLYDNRIAAAFLEGRPVTEEKHFYLLQVYKEADPKRRDIVQELDSVSWRLSAHRKTAL